MTVFITQSSDHFKNPKIQKFIYDNVWISKIIMCQNTEKFYWHYLTQYFNYSPTHCMIRFIISHAVVFNSNFKCVVLLALISIILYIWNFSYSFVFGFGLTLLLVVTFILLFILISIFIFMFSMNMPIFLLIYLQTLRSKQD